MNGNVFQCYNARKNNKQLTKILESLGEYNSKEMKFPGDLFPMWNNMKEPSVMKPNNVGDDARKLELAIWDKEISAYCNHV